jgi:hypothetical protein
MDVKTPIKYTLLKVIRAIDPDVFQFGEVLEMQRTMLVIVEAKGGIDLHVDGSLLNAAKGATHETIVPEIILGDKEITANAITEKQLALLTHASGEALGLI